MVYQTATLEEQLRQAREHIMLQQKRIDETSDNAMRYSRIRRLELVIMAEDGARYLKGTELDAYLDDLPPRGPLVRAQMLKELTPVLNTVFSEEYQRYQDEHAEHIAAHIDAEALRNVKA
jgi:hypothetical protein